MMMMFGRDRCSVAVVAATLFQFYYLPGAHAGIRELRVAEPAGWSLVGAPEGSSRVTFTIALQQDFSKLEAMLLEVATPGSPKYGKYMTKKEVDAIFMPSDQASSAVLQWLGQNIITEYNIDGPFIDFSLSVDAGNKLFNASYQHYESDGVRKLRTNQYSIPDELEKHIALIEPGTYLGRSQALFSREHGRHLAVLEPRQNQPDELSKRQLDPSCSTSITPACLQVMYNLGNYKPDPAAGSKIGFGSFLNESARYRDLAQFQDAFSLPRQNFSVELIANGTNSQDPAVGGFGEANLDVQNIMGIAGGLPVIEYITGGSPPFIPTLGQPTPEDNENEPYLPYYRYLLSKENADLPQVISNSYGDQEDGVPEDYARLTCNMIGLLGLRGITTMFSSGDGGLGGGCLAPDFKTVEFPGVFPAVCPYLTAVGGTVATSPEVAWNLSSGGFSRYFPRPSWQSATISDYLAKQVSAETKAYYGQYTNFSGRAFPDVAAHSFAPGYRIISNGQFGGEGGTSASVPVWAAIVGLLNDVRLRAGKPVLGWLNPMLYQNGSQALIDITDGFSIGCLPPSRGGSGVVPGARWNATVGWDTTTGFGTPDFQKLKDLVLRL